MRKFETDPTHRRSGTMSEDATSGPPAALGVSGRGTHPQLNGAPLSDEPTQRENMPMPSASQRSPRARRPAPSDVAFESWLMGSLRANFDDVAREPVPAALLMLVRGRATCNGNRSDGAAP